MGENFIQLDVDMILLFSYDENFVEYFIIRREYEFQYMKRRCNLIHTMKILFIQDASNLQIGIEAHIDFWKIKSNCYEEVL